MEKWGNTQVEKIMTKKPFVIEEDESVGAVLSLLREKGISHVPIVRNGKLVGLARALDTIRRKRQS
jgi:CBS domain-containing protein